MPRLSLSWVSSSPGFQKPLSAISFGEDSGVPQLVAISLRCQLLVLILSVLVIDGEIGLSQISTRQGEVSFH